MPRKADAIDLNTAIGCPYYRYTDGDNVLCEGVGTAKTTIMRFDSINARDAWVHTTCAGTQYGTCPLARTIEDKYLQPAPGTNGRVNGSGR